jgi:glycosyltransferase involved in cell wall biosynthesis
MNEHGKIWFILPYGSERGGLEKIAAKLIQRISSVHGKHCTVSMPRHAVSQEYVASFDIDRCAVNWMITGHGLRGSYLLWSAVALFSTLVRLLMFRPKLVIINLPFAFGCLGPMLALALAGQKTIAIHHHAAPLEESSSLLKRVYQWVFRRNQTWVAVSDDARIGLARYYGVNADLIKRIYNGLPPLSLETGSQSLRSELGVQQDDLIVTTVSRLAPGKGVEDLLPLSKAIFSKIPGVRMVVAGGGPLFEETVARFKADPEGKSIYFLGHRSDIGRILNESDIFLLPSHSEGCPLSVIEAMQAGLPVVAYSVTSIPEIVKQGKTGLLVEKGNWQGLADGVIKLCEDAAMRHMMGINGKKEAVRFSEEVMFAEYDQLLTEAGILERS